MSKLLNAMKNNVGTTLTENGALTLNKSGSKVLDFYSKGGALRSRSESDVVRIFLDAFDEDALLALKTLFYLRDVRGGQGERRLFRVCLKELAKNHSSSFIANIDNIVEFGRWDDLFVAFDTPAESAVISKIKEQLSSDVRNAGKNSISLLAKWMPSENTSSKATKALARRFIKALDISPKKYRRTLTSLRATLNVVETAMSSGDWASIDFESVPSKANLLYKKAFSKHEPVRYVEFIKAVQSGEKKINASTLFPYEVIRQIATNAYSVQTNRDTFDVLWKALPDYLKDNPHNGLVVADVSGSMCSGGGSVRPIDVSISLAIYFAQKNVGIFKNHFLTFTDDSKLQQIRSSNIVDAYGELSRAEWGGSTNLQSAFDSILDVAVKNRIPESEMPRSLVIISDMEFNVACSNNRSTNFEVIKRKYAASGYSLPKIIFWNVAARNDQSPVKFDESGTALVSGCSPSIFKGIMSETWSTPYDLMLETLNSDRYSSITVR